MKTGCKKLTMVWILQVWFSLSSSLFLVFEQLWTFFTLWRKTKEVGSLYWRRLCLLCIIKHLSIKGFPKHTLQMSKGCIVDRVFCERTIWLRCLGWVRYSHKTFVNMPHVFFSPLLSLLFFCTCSVAVIFITCLCKCSRCCTLTALFYSEWWKNWQHDGMRKKGCVSLSKNIQVYFKRAYFTVNLVSLTFSRYKDLYNIHINKSTRIPLTNIVIYIYIVIFPKGGVMWGPCQ